MSRRELIVTSHERGLDRYLGLLNGPQTLGRGPTFWFGFLAVVAVLALGPDFLPRYEIIKFSNLLTSAFLALSLCLIWGYCGILSLGQAVFYGLGGYAYGIIALNLFDAHGNTDVAFVGGILVPVVFAAIVGAIMFFARLRGVYVAIMMLMISLLFETFLLQTAGREYTIGAAWLGGYNGLGPALPSSDVLPNLILGLGDSVIDFDGRTRSFYYLTLGLLVAVYLSLRCLVNSSFGYMLIACRENADRTETFGYDVRRIQLAVFCIAAAIGALSGVLYTAWGAFIHPKAFGVAPNLLVVIWVAVGGRRDLTAAVIGAVVLEWVSLRLTAAGEISLIVLGGILVVVMLLSPEGVVVTIADRAERLRQRIWPRSPASPDPGSRGERP